MPSISQAREVKVLMDNMKKKYVVLSPERTIALRKRINEFAKIHNVPEYMAVLFINEVRMSDDEANRNLREKAELMGLM